MFFRFCFWSAVCNSKIAANRGKVGSKLKDLSNSFEKKPITVPFKSAITSVPQPMPLISPKNANVIITLAVRQERSTVVFRRASFIPYLAETAFTKKSYTCGKR